MCVCVCVCVCVCLNKCIRVYIHTSSSRGPNNIQQIGLFQVFFLPLLRSHGRLNSFLWLVGMNSRAETRYLHLMNWKPKANHNSASTAYFFKLHK